MFHRIGVMLRGTIASIKRAVNMHFLVRTNGKNLVRAGNVHIPIGPGWVIVHHALASTIGCHREAIGHAVGSDVRCCRKNIGHAMGNTIGHAMGDTVGSS